MWSSGCREPSMVHRYLEEIVHNNLFLLYHLWGPVYSVSSPYYSTAVVLTNLAITSNISNSMYNLQFLAFNSMKSLSDNSLPISLGTPLKTALQILFLYPILKAGTIWASFSALFTSYPPSLLGHFFPMCGFKYHRNIDHNIIYTFGIWSFASIFFWLSNPCS